jgi:hypothetical protein
MVLKLITDKHYQLLPTTTLTLEPFKAVHSLIIKKIPLNLVTGLSRLRPQIRLLVIQRSGLQSVEEVLDKCGGDNSAPFSWASLKEMDLSHNTVSQLGPSLQFLTAIEKMDLSNNAITDASTGIEFIDSVSHLHLGFNQLTVVPRLGPRAKFNLTGLNLRNNRLSTIEGLQELDSLTDLDLTDNLLTRHSDLKPLQNLHNLSLLSLIGNPLSFHSKHRLKTVEALSDLINPSSFRLDNKRLTSNEKKAIPRSPTHYPHSSPSISSLTPSVSPLHTHHTLTPPPSSHLVKGSSPSRHSDTVIISKRRRKKPPATRVVALDDSDEDSLNDTGGSAATDMPSSSSVPLKYERRLQRMKDLAKQMPDKWLLSNASLDTTSSGQHGLLFTCMYATQDQSVICSVIMSFVYM